MLCEHSYDTKGSLKTHRINVHSWKPPAPERERHSTKGRYTKPPSPQPTTGDGDDGGKTGQTGDQEPTGETGQEQEEQDRNLPPLPNLPPDDLFEDPENPGGTEDPTNSGLVEPTGQLQPPELD